MGNFLERILNKMNVTDEDDFDDFDDFDSDSSFRKERKKSERLNQTAVIEEPQSFRKESSRSASLPAKAVKPQKISEEEKFDYDYSESRKERPQRPERVSTSGSRVVPLRSASASKILEVSIMKPTRFDDSQDICDMLVNERATVVNLEGIDLVLAQRIMDFISGAVYSLNGKIHQISNLIFIISPENVDISGDYLSYVEQNGFEVPTLNQ
ncbi:MAG: cell division protein SepF [Lachnospiraceae bacterium]|nr:cell division protein SepF [Lachnospiraceae bacterium]